MIKIFIVDDHEIMRKSLKLILKDEIDMIIVGEAISGLDLLDKIREADCDIVLLDLNMPGIDGIELIVELKKIKPKLKILILSIQPEKKYALTALNAGASGYICKDTALNELVTALRKIQANGKYLSHSFTEQLVFGGILTEKLPQKELTDIEYKIMISISTGKEMKEIAESMLLSISSVFSYRLRILKKLNLKSNLDLTHYAFDKKLI
ncbi:MAG: response regulator transcription factor [Paludibacter sp.]